MSGTVAYSCAFPPSVDVVAKARLAERLGYQRVWMFESPALHGDMWIGLARVAEATQRIGLATGVAVPGLRHPMVTASAIGSVHELAPGRLITAFGTGYTSRSLIGQKPIRWADLTRYVQQVRALLRGETIDIDGHACQMRHLPGFGPHRPIEVPIWIAASGPAGLGAARDLEAAGLVLTALPPEDDGIPVARALLRFGTVLQPGEDHTSPRVVEAAGPGYASTVHAVWQQADDAVDTLPGGARWRAAVDATRPSYERHLIAHEGHLTVLTERDRDLITAAGPMLLRPGWTGDPDTIREHLGEARAAGITEVIYVPAGPNIIRELEAFATAANG
jgi:5,10-methylenetetrahydromethanopterin reductase